MKSEYNTLEFDYDKIREIKLKMNKEKQEKEAKEKKDLESKLNTKSQSQIFIPNNKIYTSNSSMDEMVDYFISEGKDYPANSPRESLEKLRAEKGEDVPIMTFAEAVKRYNKTGKKCWNTTDNVYFRLQTDEGKKIINLSGTKVSMPNTYEDALKIYVDLKNNQYNNTSIEVLVDDDINTKNATQHTFAVIIDNKLEASGYNKTKNWIDNTFVKFMNGGKLGVEKLAKGYDYHELGSFYSFKKSEDGKFEVGCPVHLYNGNNALLADLDYYIGQFRG
jgi:archaellin